MPPAAQASLFAQTVSASLQGRVALGPRAGQALRRLRSAASAQGRSPRGVPGSRASACTPTWRCRRAAGISWSGWNGTRVCAAVGGGFSPSPLAGSVRLPKENLAKSPRYWEMGAGIELALSSACVESVPSSPRRGGTHHALAVETRSRSLGPDEPNRRKGGGASYLHSGVPPCASSATLGTGLAGLCPCRSRPAAAPRGTRVRGAGVEYPP
jgi:hypothetical protein